MVVLQRPDRLLLLRELPQTPCDALPALLQGITPSTVSPRIPSWQVNIASMREPPAGASMSTAAHKQTPGRRAGACARSFETWCMVVLITPRPTPPPRPHRLGPSGPAPGYNPVNGAPTLRTSRTPPEPTQPDIPGLHADMAPASAGAGPHKQRTHTQAHSSHGATPTYREQDAHNSVPAPPRDSIQCHPQAPGPALSW